MAPEAFLGQSSFAEFFELGILHLLLVTQMASWLKNAQNLGGSENEAYLQLWLFGKSVIK
jgi:hypothetical protein